MKTSIHRPLKGVALSANCIARQCFELSKQLQAERIDVALLSETHLKPHERYCIRNFHVYRTDGHPDVKGGIAVAVIKVLYIPCRPNSPCFYRRRRGLHSHWKK